MSQASILRNHIGIQLSGRIPEMPSADIETIQYAIKSLSFVVPWNKKTSIPEWIEAIKTAYSTETPQIAAVIHSLERMEQATLEMEEQLAHTEEQAYQPMRP